MKIGLTLSGGGVRGIAHLGVIKALEEMGYTIEVISGSSAGAIAGAFYAAGISPDSALEIIKSRPFLRLMKPALSARGFISMDWLEEEIEKNLPVKTFEELKIPVTIAATDLRRGKTVYFDRGPIVKTIMASSCIPILFYPVKIDGREYVDGGILNNLPAEVIRDRCETLIGVNCNPISTDFQPQKLRSIMERTFLLAISTNINASREHCDHFLEPAGLERFRVMEISRAEEIFDIGYTYAMDKLAAVLKDQ